MTAQENSAVFNLIKSWGFGDALNEQLIEHADQVLRLKGKMVGEILADLGIATRENVEALLKTKPEKEKTLEFLSDIGMKGLTGNVDRILAIQNGKPYISRGFPQLVLHPVLAKKDKRKAIEHEMNKWGTLPMLCGDHIILMFDDFTKLASFTRLGKTDRIRSPLFQTLAGITGERPESVVLKPVLAKNNVHIEYQQALSDGGDSADSGEDGLQTIYQYEAEKDPAIAQLVRILNESIQQETNDVAIVPDRKTGAGRVLFRKYQNLYDSKISLTPTEREQITRILLSRSKANPSGSRLRHPVDGNLNFDGKLGQAFLRLSFIPLEESQFASTSVSIRVLPRTSKHVEMGDLNIDPELQKELTYFLNRKSGLFVVCGPTGSGKSTTIAAMLCEHEKKFGDSLKRMSVEQPCERILPGVLHIDVSQHRYSENERASDTDNFGMALRAILRHDPDVVFVGEVRDKESCVTSVDGSNTGHLVFTTTHSNDPILGYRRLASFLDRDRLFDLVSVLEGILAQRLVKLVCNKCCKPHPMDDEALTELNRYAKNMGINLDAFVLPDHYNKANKQGCADCIDGYSGMWPVHGLLTMNPEVRALLLSKDERDWMKAQSASDSKFTLFNGAFKLFKEGKIDFDTVML